MTVTFRILELWTMILLLSIPIETRAAIEKSFTVFKATVSVTLSENWLSVTKEIGVPVKLMGPIYEESRPVITITPIDMKNEVIVLDDQNEALLSYKKSRLIWLQKFNGTIINFDLIKTYTVNNNKFHQFGLSYEFNGENFSEKSHYVECNKKIFHIKTLIRLEHLKKWDDEVAKITNSFQCK